MSNNILISDILSLKAKKKQLEELLQKPSSNTWIQIYKNMEEFSLTIERYKHTLDNSELTPRQKDNINRQIQSEQNILKRKESELLEALLLSIPKADIQKELDEIKEKEKEYIAILLHNAKEQYKQELQRLIVLL
jgi:hypothetical protein